MIKLLQRTETEKSAARILWQQADIGRELTRPITYPWAPTVIDSCYFCRYRQTFADNAALNECITKHACYGTKYPYIQMSRVIDSSLTQQYENPDGSDLWYQATSIFKQVTFEAQPHHITLMLCNNGQAQCNAHCWFHGWRLANKRTVTQCGKAHLCQNDGSLWTQLAPTNQILYDEFKERL